MTALGQEFALDLFGCAQLTDLGDAGAEPLLPTPSGPSAAAP